MMIYKKTFNFICFLLYLFNIKQLQNLNLGQTLQIQNIIQPRNLMVELPIKDSTYKPIWMVTRMIFNCVIYYSIINEPGFTDELCGPLAIPVQADIYHLIVMIEVCNFLLPLLLLVSTLLSKGNSMVKKLNQLRFPRVFFLMLLKLFIIFHKNQRKRYYMHVFLIELLIWVCTIIYDCIGFPKISQIWQIIIIDSFQRVSIFYAITRTFCPNFAIYWFIVNLLLLIFSQLQAHFLYHYPKSQKLDPIFPAALYVKQDIYRWMVLTFLYFGLFAFLQSKDYGYGMTVVFMVSVYPFIKSIKLVQIDQYKKSIMLLLVVCLFIMGFIVLRICEPSFFKVFQSKGPRICGVYDQFLLQQI